MKFNPTNTDVLDTSALFEDDAYVLDSSELFENNCKILGSKLKDVSINNIDYKLGSSSDRRNREDSTFSNYKDPRLINAPDFLVEAPDNFLINQVK